MVPSQLHISLHKSTAARPFSFCGSAFLFVSAGGCRLLRLRGGRSSADSARGTRPSGLPSIACGRDERRLRLTVAALSAYAAGGLSQATLRSSRVSISETVCQSTESPINFPAAS